MPRNKESQLSNPSFFQIENPTPSNKEQIQSHEYSFGRKRKFTVSSKRNALGLVEEIALSVNNEPRTPLLIISSSYLPTPDGTFALASQTRKLVTHQEDPKVIALNATSAADAGEVATQVVPTPLELTNNGGQKRIVREVVTSQDDEQLRHQDFFKIIPALGKIPDINDVAKAIQLAQQYDASDPYGDTQVTHDRRSGTSVHLFRLSGISGVKDSFVEYLISVDKSNHVTQFVTNELRASLDPHVVRDGLPQDCIVIDYFYGKNGEVTGMEKTSLNGNKTKYKASTLDLLDGEPPVAYVTSFQEIKRKWRRNKVGRAIDTDTVRLLMSQQKDILESRGIQTMGDVPPKTSSDGVVTEKSTFKMPNGTFTLLEVQKKTSIDALTQEEKTSVISVKADSLLN